MDRSLASKMPTCTRLMAPWRLFADLVKFEHTIFALPFAYIGCLLGADGHPTWPQLFWVTAAMVGARTAGMTLNRLIDRSYDGRNPRTRDRAIPAGRVSPTLARAIVVASLLLLLVAAARLSPLALMLSPLAVALLLLYSYLKRFTWLCHVGIGLVLACAPVGGWVGVRGTLETAPLCVAAAVLLWVAGFDILYACLDVDFDCREGLHSIPARFGVARSLLLARAFHVVSVLALAAAGRSLELSGVYFVGVGIVAALLVYEHRLVQHDDLSRLDAAFFTMNGWVSVTLFAFTWLEYLFGASTRGYL